MDPPLILRFKKSYRSFVTFTARADNQQCQLEYNMRSYIIEKTIKRWSEMRVTYDQIQDTSEKTTKLTDEEQDIIILMKV